jgi:hypothetical protein
VRSDFEGGALTGQYNGMASTVAPAPFKPTSVFDKSQVIKNPNGRSQGDQSRTFVNGTPQSVNGLSSTTFDTKSWIGSPYRTFGA